MQFRVLLKASLKIAKNMRPELRKSNKLMGVSTLEPVFNLDFLPKSE
jgi:hypothetical protein